MVWVELHENEASRATNTRDSHDYLEAKIEHVFVDPDLNFVYTRHKRRLLGLEDALDPNTPNSSAPSDNTKKIAFPTDGSFGWGTALAKSPLFTCAEIDRYIANSGEKKAPKQRISLVAYKTSKSQGFSG